MFEVLRIRDYVMIFSVVFNDSLPFALNTCGNNIDFAKISEADEQSDCTRLTRVTNKQI